MAYGSPANIDEVEDYFTDIRGGRPPTPQALEALKEKYQRIGGPSGLTEITHLQAAALQQLLDAEHPDTFDVFTGMKHWHPFIADTVAEIHRDGISKVIGLVLAPHFSRKSIGEYEQRILSADQNLQASLDLHMIKSWYDDPDFIGFVASNVEEALEDWEPNDGHTRVFFTAHSIPQKVIDEGDPYAEQLDESAEQIATAAGIEDWEVAWQSASATGEPWVGPDILESLDSFKLSGGKRAVVAPIGFVSDHLEILYDVDIECQDKAAQLELELRRIKSPNDNSRFIKALGNVVKNAAAGS